MKLFFPYLILIAMICSCPAAPITESILNQYRPVTELFRDKQIKEGIELCRKLAPQNPLAAHTLFLIHSEGLYDTPVNYVLAAQYYAMYPNHLELARQNFEDNIGSYPPTAKESEIVLLQSDDPDDEDSPPEAPQPVRYKLTGAHAKADCLQIQSEMTNGGVCARVLLSESPNAPLYNTMANLAQKLGRLKLSLLGNMQMPSSEKLDPYLQCAAQGNHLAMQNCAWFYAVGAQNCTPDLRTSNEMLNQAQALVEQAEKNGCICLSNHLWQIQQTRKAIPNADQPTEMLISLQKDHSFSRAIRRELARRDHPYGWFLKSNQMRTEGKGLDQARALMLKAAQSGLFAAQKMLLYDPETSAAGFVILERAAQNGNQESLTFLTDIASFYHKGWEWYLLAARRGDNSMWTRALNHVELRTEEPHYADALVRLSKLHAPARKRLEEYYRELRETESHDTAATKWEIDANRQIKLPALRRALAEHGVAEDGLPVPPMIPPPDKITVIASNPALFRATVAEDTGDTVTLNCHTAPSQEDVTLLILIPKDRPHNQLCLSYSQPQEPEASVELQYAPRPDLLYRTYPWSRISAIPVKGPLRALLLVRKQTKKEGTFLFSIRFQ